MRTGSSPLARGLRRHPRLRRRPYRIIPARAGFTSTASCTRCSCGDHPRSRGVYSENNQLNRKDRGSSPLARGLQSSEISSQKRWWIIPARAGFTKVVKFRPRKDGDHPRSRGVYGGSQKLKCGEWGSSPLARGLLNRLLHGGDYVGIIPARAGFTGPVGGVRVHLGDHPRSRGVYTGWSCGWHAPRGSSPLARGLRFDEDRRPLRVGIIPARAGFTLR